MDYVQLPVAGFYFVLGAITGVIVFIIVIGMLAKKEEKKNKEKIMNMPNQLATMSNEEPITTTEKKTRKPRTKKNDK